jgi:hypothetical protein
MRNVSKFKVCIMLMFDAFLRVLYIARVLKSLITLKSYEKEKLFMEASYS